MRKLRQLQPAYYPDLLQNLDDPVIGVEVLVKDIEAIKEKVIPKKTVVKKTVTVESKQRKVSTYNVFIKEKRIELMTLYPKMSKIDIYEMAKKAYRDTKENSDIK